MDEKLSRRQFMKTSAALAVTGSAIPLSALGSPRATEAQPAASSPLPLGVASYSFRKFDRQRVIGFMKQLNTPFLNVKDVHLPITTPDAIRQAAAEFAAAGIKLTAAGAIYFPKNDEADVRQKFEYCRLIGVPVMVAAPSPEALTLVEKCAKEYDIKVAIHNHGPEDKLYPSPLDAWKVVQGMDAHMGICLDVGHAARAGVNLPDTVRLVGPRLYDVHMKDLANVHEKESQVAVGDGVLPIPQIFEALLAVKYRGYVDLEYEINENDPMPGMIKSFAYMRGVLAGMGYKA